MGISWIMWIQKSGDQQAFVLMKARTMVVPTQNNFRSEGRELGENDGCVKAFLINKVVGEQRNTYAPIAKSNFPIQYHISEGERRGNGSTSISSEDKWTYWQTSRLRSRQRGHVELGNAVQLQATDTTTVVATDLGRKTAGSDPRISKWASQIAFRWDDMEATVEIIGLLSGRQRKRSALYPEREGRVQRRPTYFELLRTYSRWMRSLVEVNAPPASIPDVSLEYEYRDCR